MSPLQRLLSQWETSVEIEPGKRIRVRRPASGRVYRFRAGVTPELLAEHCVGWDGFTEADVLGDAHASPDECAFDTVLLTELLADRPEWFAKISDALTTAIVKRLNEIEAATKN